MSPTDQRPNIVIILTDDHAAQAIGAYHSVINQTPAVDRLAAEGMTFDNAFCTNAICSPARASVLTGTYSHVNGMTCNATHPRRDAAFDASQPAFPELLQAAGYQTALVGKWHLGHGERSDPRGFDYWQILPDHGTYHDPRLLTCDGDTLSYPGGYVTDVITDQALNWLDRRAQDKPFALLIWHKAPHRTFEPAPRHRNLYAHEDIPVPPTLHDDYSHRSRAAREARLRLEDLEPADLKAPVPEGLSPRAEREWRYQRYIKEYLRVIAGLDENVGRVLHYLNVAGLADDTLVAYTSDHGFFLGEHGWFDKRFMYEQSLRIPLVVRWPGVIEPGVRNDDIVINVDYAQTVLDIAGVEPHERMQGRSLRPLLEGRTPDDWRSAMYYRYFEHRDPCHEVQANYGIRTRTHKLIHYPGQGTGQPVGRQDRCEPEWELFDLGRDPHELHNRYDDPEYAELVKELTDQLTELQLQYGDTPLHTSRACCGPARRPRRPMPATVVDIPTDPAAAARLRRRMVALPGGSFLMGSDDPDVNPGDAEGPVRRVTVAPFLISPTTVTNTEFAVFVKRTGYRTTADRFGWSYVFAPLLSGEGRAAVRGSVAHTPWWVAVAGADWRHPHGPGSGIGDRSNHPVVHISRDDALAYCAWARVRLPTEPEWEYAARGGLPGARYPWGDELHPEGRHMCNIWQGTFPHHNTGDDGHVDTAPVRAYRPNGYGLHNMAGNVWEWTGDPWASDTLDEWAMRGGSYLCHHTYCNRYRVAARTHNSGDSSGANLGFRVAADAP